MKLILLCFVFVHVISEELKTLGAPNFSCDPKVMAKSASVPKNVNQVRFADIKVVATLGDSLSAGNGAGAQPGDPLAVILQFRGLCFQAGGEFELENQITVPNILKKFNPRLFGYAKGTGSENVWSVAYLDAGIPGDESKDIIAQAHSIIAKMKAHPESVDIQNDWKLVNIFIGANDICAYCDDRIRNQTGMHTPQHFHENIMKTLQILKDNLPRTIVSLTGMFNMGLLRTVDKNQAFCDALHVFECHCEMDQNFTNAEMTNISIGYQLAEQQIQDAGVFEADDFTFVIQPFFEDLLTPPRTANGSVDLTFFAPDCFHFSKFGHAVVAKNLWNNILQPVGQKQRNANLSDISPTLSCPDSNCPFFRTVKNSKNCAGYWTPSELDV